MEYYGDTNIPISNTEEIVIVEYSSDFSNQIAKLFYDTVHKVNAKDYSEAQLIAWAPDWLDSIYWDKRIQENDYAIVALSNEAVVGFCSVDDTGYLDLLYVKAEFQGMGIATKLLADIEAYLDKKGVRVITTHSSITAKTFFINRGFLFENMQSVEVRGEHFINYVLNKTRDVLL